MLRKPNSLTLKERRYNEMGSQGWVARKVEGALL